MIGRMVWAPFQFCTDPRSTSTTQHHDLMSPWHSGYYIDVVYNTNLLKGMTLCFPMLSWELDLTQCPTKIHL
jgi:hypothetical protein